jgi:catechol 2,3-dioxygenase-like lactoylglutathione lyase family enzyme
VTATRSGTRIAAVRLNCPDPARTAAFYAAAFDATLTPRAGGVVVALGGQRLDLVPTAAAPSPPAASNSVAFQHCALVVADVAAARARLEAVPGWSAISRAGPERLPAASGGVTAFKFRDPDGHPLEFLAFPDGGAPPAWAGRAGLFLGIDHSAVTVSDSARSVAFYEALGFAVAHRGLNRGEEQARMDGLAAPVVEVTGLTPPGGGPIDLELLCYREPGPLAARLRDDDPLATRLVLTGEGGPATDPDGHRLAWEPPTP